MVHGLGVSAYSRHRDIFKLISKSSLTDRVMFVRVAAVKVSYFLEFIFECAIFSVFMICARNLQVQFIP
jgi:hypothetical protein